MKLVICVLAGAILLATVASAAPASLGWVKGDRAPEDALVRVHFGVAQETEGVESLRQKFLSVSDPASGDYAKYWAHDELLRTVVARPESMAALQEWLAEFGVEGVVRGTGDLVSAEMTAATAARMFGAPVHVYQHAAGNARTILRAETTASVPAALAPHVDFVFGLSNFPEVRLSQQEGAAVAAAVQLGNSVTPAVLRKLYSVGDNVGSGASNSSQACAEFQHQSYSKTDLHLFESHFDIAEQDVRTVYGDNSGLGHTEANLDVQYVIAMGQKVPTDFWIETGYSFDLVQWVGEVLSKPHSPLVWSVSYGEALSAVTADYARRLDGEFKKMAVLGVSVLFASGDSGVYSRSGGTASFHPSYPACLPSVTAVGATQLDSDGAETTAVAFSGGGFSLDTYFKRSADAPWQADAVSTYFSEAASTLPPANMYHADGVGFPDVSAQGVNFQVYLDFFRMGVSGTSASCPTVAGIVGLLNDARMKAGKGPLGFLNQLFYKNGAAFRDILKGDNNNNNQYGFTAAKGWDPTSGMGTPNFEQLKQVVMQLQ